ncbi:MAG: EF-hand domain-containing protein [Pseudoxanthomonas sp.]
MRRHSLLTLAVLAVLASGTAIAATPASSSKPAAPHAKLDTNGDGDIDRGEAAKAPRLAEQFDALDTNKDGKLSPGELRAARGERGRHGPHRGHDRMAKLDSNKDGRISAEEAKADPKFAARFAEMDANKDGFVDKADLAQRMKQHRDDWFAKADTNQDGQLSKAEFDAAKPDRPKHERGRRGHDGKPMPHKPAGDAKAQ